MSTVLTATPGQTIGPFFSYALPFANSAELVPPGSPGSIRLHGVVSDGAGAPVPDALIEIWQADAHGVIPSSPGSLRRDGWSFTGWGRAGTDPQGHYSFSTVTPGATEADSAQFFALTVFARGLLNRLFTRAYLPGDRLRSDRLLTSVPVERRRTLIAEPDDQGFRFDIRLQGAEETVFLHYPAHLP
ncbi:protocatechuate 3,4-dioxygenase subunit alpha [Mycobacterium avium]|jgi:protocatechuate 3,4-dioxygenase alpha subunit|uniref:protocatechuate 3,4-dioxygenase subunit alpha n=1 Tax=Mycobacterium avium TaxID=1764 RepID=UPI0007A06F38|nr:protocatechuate 3,4-dioxygenase subunit alpha [Mycobacterium avium]